MGSRSIQGRTIIKALSGTLADRDCNPSDSGRDRHLLHLDIQTSGHRALTTPSNKGAAANRRQVLRSAVMDNLNLNITLNAHRPAVAELER